MLSRVAEANGAPALEGMNVLVLVQGELAQSPRMLNHARALSDAGATGDLAGYTQGPTPRAAPVRPSSAAPSPAPKGSIRSRAPSICRPQRQRQREPRCGSAGFSR